MYNSNRVSTARQVDVFIFLSQHLRIRGLLMFRCAMLWEAPTGLFLREA